MVRDASTAPREGRLTEWLLRVFRAAGRRYQQQVRWRLVPFVY